MRPTDFAVGITPEHPRNLHHARVVRHDRRIGGGDGAHGTLVHHDVVMSPRGDLCQVGNGQDLMMGRDTPHQRPHLPCHGATNAGVNFVEDERRYRLETREHG
ncbi:MAG: hypothetical protein ACK559_41810, partial [bacterium]